jgi:hypothetical protein
MKKTLAVLMALVSAQAKAEWKTRSSIDELHNKRVTSATVFNHTEKGLEALTIQCFGRDLAVMVAFSGFLTIPNKVSVTYRIDDQEPVDTRWDGNQQAIVAPRADRFVQDLLNGKRLLIGASTRVTSERAAFDLTGIETAVPPVLAACGIKHD